MSHAATPLGVSPDKTVLLVGGTGRTGQRVLCRLLERGVAVRAVVRSAGRLPPGVAGDPRLTVVEADLLALDDESLAAQVRGCEAVVSCLGHTISLRGVFGPPHDLVARATALTGKVEKTALVREALKALIAASVVPMAAKNAAGSVYPVVATMSMSFWR